MILEDWPEYQRAILEDYQPKSVGQENVIAAIKSNPNGSYLLNGLYSRGKTHLLIAQYRALAIAGQRCVLRTARGLIEELRKTEVPADGKQPEESPVLQLVNLSTDGHLFIDDIDKAPARSGFRLEMLFDLFDTIKRRQLALTVTSNMPMFAKDGKDLRSILGDPVVSRLHTICTEIQI